MCMCSPMNKNLTKLSPLSWAWSKTLKSTVDLKFTSSQSLFFFVFNLFIICKSFIINQIIINFIKNASMNHKISHKKNHFFGDSISSLGNFWSSQDSDTVFLDDLNCERVLGHDESLLHWIQASVHNVDALLFSDFLH